MGLNQCDEKVSAHGRADLWLKCLNSACVIKNGTLDIAESARAADKLFDAMMKKAEPGEKQL